MSSFYTNLPFRWCAAGPKVAVLRPAAGDVLSVSIMEDVEAEVGQSGGVVAATTTVVRVVSCFGCGGSVGQECGPVTPVLFAACSSGDGMELC